jgi:hypothetical protein
MVRLKLLVEEADTLSVTFNVKLTGPAAGGVPLNTPALVMLSQAGKVEPLSEKVRVPVPPVAAIVWEYSRDTVQDGSGEDVVMVGKGFTVTAYELVVDA